MNDFNKTNILLFKQIYFKMSPLKNYNHKHQTSDQILTTLFYIITSISTKTNKSSYFFHLTILLYQTILAIPHNNYRDLRDFLFGLSVL